MLTSLFQSGVVTQRLDSPHADEEKRSLPPSSEGIPGAETSSLQLADVLAEHRVWVDSDGQAGTRADLTNNFLPGIDLSGVSLRGAFLRKAGLAGADLCFADLRDACLVHATLDKTNLLHAKLRGAGLQGACLEGASSLLPEQLGGTSLFGAALPKPILEGLFEKTRAAAATSRLAQRLLIGMLTASACAAMAVIRTSDLQIVQNAPMIGIASVGRWMPVEGFYMLAPVLLLGLYVAFHVVLLGLWERLADLPAVYPDGQPLDRKARWTLINLVRSRMRWLNEDRLPVSALQRTLLLIPAYWIVPATLILFWGRYLTRLDVHASSYHATLTAAAIVLAAVLPVSGHAIFPPADSARARRGATRRSVAIRVSLAACAVMVLFALSLGIVTGAPHDERNLGHVHAVSQKWAAQILWLAGYDPFPRISEAEVSRKPAGWSNAAEQLTEVRGPRLDGRRLRHADAFAAFLVNARLSVADLQETNLVAADLRGAILRRANLQLAVLDRAQLGGADLHGADLSKASLVNADLNGANFAYAVLEEATLLGARLDGATLYAANLRRASLPGAFLQSADLRESDLSGAEMNATVLTKAQLWGAVLANAQLRDADLEEAMLAEGDLRGADLQGAQLRAAHLVRAQLDGANLEGAQMEGASGLTGQQLCAAKNWRRAKLDEELRRQAEAECKAIP